MFKKKKPMVNAVFGKMRHWALGWTLEDKLQFVLWTKSYELSVSIVDNQEKCVITKLQEDIYTKFKENLEENQKKVEQIVSNFYNTSDVYSLISKFIPYEVQINTNGECAIIAENTEDEDIHDVLPGLAVILYPKMAIFTEEAYTEYVLLSGDEDIRKELYGD